MIFITLILSLSVTMVTLILPAWADYFIVAAPIALACAILLLSNHVVERRQKRKDNTVVIDGSNVMHWHRGKPQIETVQEVVKTLRKKGFYPGVIFDANAGHVLTGRYRDERYFRRKLRLPRDHVMVVPKGTQADPFILSAAKACKGRVVSNDRFRDWVKQHPEVATPGHVIKGGFRSGSVWLGLPKNQA